MHFQGTDSRRVVTEVSLKLKETTPGAPEPLPFEEESMNKEYFRVSKFVKNILVGREGKSKERILR